MNIIIRAAEPTDFESIRETMAQPLAYAGTLQVPLPSAELWKKRLAELPPGDHMVRIDIKDSDGRVATTSFVLKVEK